MVYILYKVSYSKFYENREKELVCTLPEAASLNSTIALRVLESVNVMIQKSLLRPHPS